MTIFKTHTGLLGFTEPGQVVTVDNVKELPPGSVVFCNERPGKLVHLHDDLWVYFGDASWCYDTVENLSRYLPGKLSHIP